jgi:autotransporter-associated beta strand protein
MESNFPEGVFMRWSSRLLAAVSLVLLGHLPSADAQVTFTVTYQDVINGNGIGFDQGGGVGATRQATVSSMLSYLQTVIDGRGSAQLHFNVSSTSGTGPLASYGPNNFVFILGSFQNGGAFQRLRTGGATFAAPDASGQFNFGYTWNNGTGPPASNQFDLYSVALHEVLHGLGFLSGVVNASGQGLTTQPVGNPDIYAAYDRYIQRGNTLGTGNLLRTDITMSNFASFQGPASTLTNGNDPTTGLFFGGTYAAEIFGGAVPLFAPNPYQSGSSVSHNNTSPPGVMHPSIAPGVQRRTLLPYEIGMLIDMGYNNYNWNGNTTGVWLGTGTLATSNWRTHLGIARDNANTTTYNTFNFPAQAPILAPHGQITSNIVLNFGGSGSSSYTSTNDIGNFRVARINLNSTSTGTNTITGGTLIWGRNSDGTNSVLVPAIEQQNSGAFNINSTMQIPIGLTLRGSGSGTVTLGGNISGAGGLTKQGPFTAILTGTNTFTGNITISGGTLQGNTASLPTNITNNAALVFNQTSAGTYSGTISGTGSMTKTGSGTLTLTANNTYSGTTTVSAGTLLVNNTSGSGTGTGAVTVQSGASLGGTGSIAGLTTINSGGFVRPGTSPGVLTFNGGLNMSAGTYIWELAALSTSGPGTNFDQIVVTGGTLTLGGTSDVTLDFSGLAPADQPGAPIPVAFWHSSRQWVILDWTGTGNPNQVFSTITNPNFTAGTFSLSIGTGSNAGDVLLNFTPIPEPSSLALLGLAATAAYWYRRRRQSSRSWQQALDEHLAI